MNLLTDPLFHVKTDTGDVLLSLPALLEALGVDKVIDLLGLQRHQEDAFHIFICYLAGAVLVRTKKENPIQNETFWRKGLLILASGQEEAWYLVVEDPTKPAFMQPPTISKKAFNEYKPKAETPDALDLQTAKNHDVKSTREVYSSPEHWIYSLVGVQTMSGFLGQGNYGISRMNGGFGSRPCVVLRYSERWGKRFTEDVLRLISHFDTILSGAWKYIRDGIVLTWMEAWDGKTSLPLKSLHPFFIEVSRAIRLVSINGTIEAYSMPTKSPRISSKELKGMLGDPWTPINMEKQSSLTVSSSGYTPGLIRNLLFEDGYELQAMQRPIPERSTEACCLHASVLVRGQGVTEGFHECIVPIPAKTVSKLFNVGIERDRLGILSKDAISDAGAMQYKVLKPALMSLLEGGPEKVNFEKREVTSWFSNTVSSFADLWSARFFLWLWKAFDEADEMQARIEWRMILKECGLTILRNSVTRFPLRNGRRYKARVNSESLFYGCMYKIFPDLKENRNDKKH